MAADPRGGRVRPVRVDDDPQLFGGNQSNSPFGSSRCARPCAGCCLEELGFDEYGYIDFLQNMRSTSAPTKASEFSGIPPLVSYPRQTRAAALSKQTLSSVKAAFHRAPLARRRRLFACWCTRRSRRKPSAACVIRIRFCEVFAPRTLRLITMPALNDGATRE
jgi:hypothetical protein